MQGSEGVASKGCRYLCSLPAAGVWWSSDRACTRTEHVADIAEVHALKNAGAANADTDLVADTELEGVEEALEVEEDEGVTLEPFNLAQERHEGYFDEGGSYVETKAEEDEEERDAWLTSTEGAASTDTRDEPGQAMFGSPL